MERESFEDPRIAEVMNAEFVCIKVDREERPDVDSIYMGAVQAMTGRGGWPMTVFLTPEGKPFYGGTYYPPEDRHGIPGFPRVLASIANAYRQERGEVVLATERLLQQMRAMATAGRGVEPLTADVLAQAFAGIAKDFDPTHGGIGLQPKFPQPMTYEFPAALLPALRRRERAGDGRHDAGPHGDGRHIRPGRRRLPPLLHRYVLARPALREDALRQRPCSFGCISTRTRSRESRCTAA